MSHSTHVGFICPPTTTFKGGVFLFACDGGLSFFESFTVGVGNVVMDQVGRSVRGTRRG